ncbi:MAG: ATP-binding protein [Gammaproteobacteria bacterium]|nr:ATP-binding protein [Gammaproteobacteria bacterium]
MIFNSIKSQLLAISIIPIITLSIILAISYSIMQVNYISKINYDYGATLTNNIGPACEFGILTGNQDFLESIAEKIIETSHAVNVTILDQQHQILIDIESDKSHQLPENWHIIDGNINSKYYETEHFISFLSAIYSRPIDVYDDFDNIQEASHEPEGAIGYIMITLSKDATNSEKQQAYIASIAITLIAIIIFSIIAHISSNRIARPIHKLSTLTRKIEQGDLSTRSPLDGSGEIRDLQSGINSMSDALFNSHEKMQQEITKATSSFKKANTELKNKNIKLAVAEQSALDASRAKSQFLANMSHEIRTPLNGMIGFAKLLQKTKLSPIQSNYISIVQRSSHSLLNIINDILDFSKAESGNIDVDNSSVNLYDLIDNVINIVTPAAHEKDLILSYIIYDDVTPNIISDEQKIHHILLNLMSNAIKFTHQGSIEIRVSRDEEREDEPEKLLFSVTDSGIGIDKKNQQLIFEKFQQADTTTTRDYGGTGLGLSISKHFAELLNGDITLESSLGKGATFYVTLEYQPDKKATPPTTEKLLNGFNVLLHSDNKLTLFKLSHTLESLGAKAEHEISASTFNQKITRQPYDLIIIACRQQQLLSGETAQQLQLIHTQQPKCKTLVLINSCNPKLLNRLPCQLNSISISQPYTHRTLTQALQQLVSGQPQPTPKAVEIAIEVVSNLTLSHVLIAEDNPINSTLLIALLKQFKIGATLAETGKQAVELCNKAHFDLIFMDLHMPEMDGLEATALIKHKRPDLPIIATTADVLANANNALVNQGFDAVIEKPIDEQKLITCLNEWLPKGQNKTYQALIQHFNGKKKIADEMYQMLIKELSSQQPCLQSLWDNQQHQALLQLVHKLNGSASYCGLKSLQAAAQTLETTLKQSQLNRVPDELDQLLTVISDILNEAE